MREPAKTFEDILVGQKAHSFTVAVYRVTGLFPKFEIYGLTSQLRLAAVSIAANIAEGFRKRSKADKAKYLNIAQGSVEECRYYLILTEDLKYADISDERFLLREISKMLDAYMQSILTSDFYD